MAHARARLHFAVAAKGVLSLKAGGAVTLKTAFTMTGGYQIRIERLDGRKFQLGFLKRRSTDLDIDIDVSLGATPTVAGNDVIQALAANRQPRPGGRQRRAKERRPAVSGQAHLSAMSGSQSWLRSATIFYNLRSVGVRIPPVNAIY
jgi:hypothetical protein